MYNYRIFCEDEHSYVYILGTIAPTECPNSSSHLINNITIVESFNADKIFKIEPKINSINTTKFNRIGVYQIPQTKYAIVKGTIWMDTSNTSYTVKFFDKTNNISLLETVLTNTSSSVQDLGTLTDLPLTEIEIFIKKTGGNNWSKVYIENLTIYYS